MHGKWGRDLGRGGGGPRAEGVSRAAGSTRRPARSARWGGRRRRSRRRLTPWRSAAGGRASTRRCTASSARRSPPRRAAGGTSGATPEGEGEGRMRRAARMGIDYCVSRVRTFLLKLTERLSLRAAPPHPLNAERRGDAVVASSVIGSGVPASTPSGPDTSQMCSFESYEPEHTDRPCGGGRGGVVREEEGEGRASGGGGARRRSTSPRTCRRCGRSRTGR